MPYLIHKIPRPKGSGFWLVVIQVFASFNLLLSIVVFSYFIFSLYFSPNSNFAVSRCTSHFAYIFVRVGCGRCRWPLVFWGTEGVTGGVLAIYGLVILLQRESSLIILSINCIFQYHSCISWYLNVRLLPVWVEGPLGFGLLLSCRIVQAFQLYNIFVK